MRTRSFKQTNITQPAIYIHSMVIALIADKFFKPNAVAGHSLGEFTALAAANYISFEDGLRLVQKEPLQCKKHVKKMNLQWLQSLDLMTIQLKMCARNQKKHWLLLTTAGQIVISGTINAVNIACILTELGARRALVLPVREHSLTTDEKC